MKINLFTTLLFFSLLCACQQRQNDNQQKTKPPLEKPVPVPEEKETAPPSCEQSTKTYPSSNFSAALESLADSKYQYKTISIEEIAPEETLFFEGLEFANRRRIHKEEKPFAPLTLDGMLQMRRAFIKGQSAISGNMYPRAEIEEWEFKSAICVKQVLNYITQVRLKTPWDVISKSPMDYWQVENKLYFLVPGGFYMLEEAENIQKLLKSKL